MSNPDIPVEVRLAAMRANADLLDEHHNHHGAHLLRAEVAQIERDAFVDELAKAYRDTLCERNPAWPGWDRLIESARDEIRAGIRAVLAKLEETRDTDDTHDAEASKPRVWETLYSVPTDVRAVRDRNGYLIARKGTEWWALSGELASLFQGEGWRSRGPFKEASL